MGIFDTPVKFPDVESSCGPEPSLREILAHYYRQTFTADEAAALANKYIDLLGVEAEVARLRAEDSYQKMLLEQAKGTILNLRAEVEGLRNENKSLIRWECLVSWLLEKCEGESISQDLFEQEYAKMIADSIKAGGTA